MNQQEIIKDILDVIQKAVTLVDEKNYNELKELSNHTIHNASIYQDHDSITTAILIYSLSKIFEKNPFYIKEKAVSSLNKMAHCLRHSEIENYRAEQKQLIEYIKNTDKGISKYIVEVIEKAGLKKGMKVYDHGLSLSKAADLFGVSIWEMADYVGKTTISEKEYNRTDIIARLNFTRSIFNGESNE